MPYIVDLLVRTAVIFPVDNFAIVSISQWLNIRSSESGISTILRGESTFVMSIVDRLGHVTRSACREARSHVILHRLCTDEMNTDAALLRRMSIAEKLLNKHPDPNHGYAVLVAYSLVLYMLRDKRD